MAVEARITPSTPNYKAATQRVTEAWSKEGFRLVMGDVERNLTGRVLHRRSGKLLTNVKSESKLTPDGFTIATTSVYGKAWESGFTRRGYTILPQRGSMLKFMSRSGETIFRPRANVPAQRFDARPFIQPAVMANERALFNSLRDKWYAAMEAENKKLTSSATLHLKF